MTGSAWIAWTLDYDGYLEGPNPTTPEYHNLDMIGTTRMMSDAGGNPVNPVTYTAFGERVCSLPGGDCQGVPSDRYGYAGAWGYQAHDDFPFLHVGHRYYDPATGRFLQRDPIGIGGGSNVYAYAWNSPTMGVDPTGEIFWIPVLIGAAIFVLDTFAEYANAPGPDDVPLSGGPGPSPAAAYGAILMGIGVSVGEAASEWEWRGAPGSKPGDPNGSWYNPNTGESLHPDLSHGPPHGPHYDYTDPTGKKWRIFPDGRKVPKYPRVSSLSCAM